MVTTRYRLRTHLSGALALCLSFLVPGSAAHAGGIRGTVRDAVTGDVLANIDLDLFDSDFKSVTGFGDGSDPRLDDHTASDGSYTLEPLPAGDYYLQADPTTVQGYVSQYFPGAFLRSQATAIHVNDAGLVTVDFDLNRGGMISGRMLDSVTGGPVADVDLDIYAWDQSFVSTVNARSDANGDYEIGPLPSGDFYLEADTALEAMYVAQFYAGAETLEESQAVNVSDANGIGNVDFQLVQGGNLAGLTQDAVTFYALPGVDIDILDLNQKVVKSVNGKSDDEGIFHLGTLPPGQYYLRADMKAYDPYVDTWYGNVWTIESATLVDVTAGTVTSPLMIQVIPGGWISGTVQLSSGAPLVGVDMDVYTGTGEFLPKLNASTDANGSFQLGPMPVGDYIVRADPRGVYDLRPMYTGGASLIANATPVAVDVGIDLTGTDFVYPVSADTRPDRENSDLAGASPNPFNPRTTISFRLSERQRVRLTIHDVRGRLVAVLADGTMLAGTHRFVWDGLTDDGVRSATGVHFMQLQTPDRTERKKLVLLK
jgi:hypothetical protein